MSNTLRPDELLAQEHELILPSLSETDAIDIGQLILARAIQEDLPITVEVRRGSRAVFRAARPNTDVDNDHWIAGKVRVVERFGHASLYVRRSFEAEGTTFEAATGLSPLEYAAAGGAVPLVVDGTGRVGVAIVSGLSQEDDHDLVVEAVREFRRGARASLIAGN